MALSLELESFPLTYSLMAIILLWNLSCNSMLFSGCSALPGVNPSLKKSELFPNKVKINPDKSI